MKVGTYLRDLFFANSPKESVNVSLSLTVEFDLLDIIP